MEQKEFTSAERYALHDIAEHNKERAEKSMEEPYSERYLERPGMWLDSISQIVGSLFITGKILANRKTRRLNKELGLNKVNKHGKNAKL